MKKQKIYIVAGPTASGKSGLALELAKNKKGQIVNADAFQVYWDLRILTARPTPTEEQPLFTRSGISRFSNPIYRRP